MIPVTRPFLPPRDDVFDKLEGVFERNWLTNNGPLVNDYELRLKEYLCLDHLLFVGNGTIALQIAIKALGLKGEIITTPFSYVATTSSIAWEGCTPVFVDVDPDTFNIDPSKLESAIGPNTSAILATHCFGNPCDIEAIDLLAKKHGLKTIYDAAHCFGTTYKGKSIFEYGDISTLSLHATKLVHSVEGGAVFTKDPKLLKKMAYMRNFGHDGPAAFNGVGINGKNSEFHAAMGLSVLEYADEILARRRSQVELYIKKLQNLNVRYQKLQVEGVHNHSYCPIVFNDQEQMHRSIQELNAHEIFPRRYFYPLLSELDYVERTDLPVAQSISKAILCLPLYFELSEEEISFISRILLRTQNYR